MPESFVGDNLNSERDWLDDFVKKNRRPLKVLHVGNIAANGYLNAKFLRRIGVEADVLVCDYFHVMACPEWEEVDLTKGHGSDINPTFSKTDLGSYRRPGWFYHGTLEQCLEQLGLPPPQTLARRFRATAIPKLAAKCATALLGPNATRLLRPIYNRSLVYFHDWPQPISSAIRSLIGRPFRRRDQINKSRNASAIYFRNDASLREKSEIIAEKFAEIFPNRPDQLQPMEITPWLIRADSLRKLFDRYDIIQCYALEPVSALLSGKRPYVAFEHGTLRDFTQQDATVHRLTALSYRCADHSFITNGDCIEYAKRLGMKNYSPIIHPVDVEQHRQDFSREAAEIRKELSADILIFSPARHEYAIKGTDIAVKSLPLIKKAFPNQRVKMVMADWGTQVEQSKALVNELGCSENVVWKSALCRIAMIKMIQAADCVLDQFVLPVFGSTAPQSIATGTPVIASYDPKETAWLIPEPAPILSADTPKAVAEQVSVALDPIWLANWQIKAKNWTDRYHHPDVAIKAHLSVYRAIIEARRDGS